MSIEENKKFRASVRSNSLRVFAQIATPKEKKSFIKIFSENINIDPHENRHN